MTEVVLGNAEQQSDSNAAAQQSGSAGMLLRQAREQQHMSVQTLASALKVPVYKLQALEEDRWDVLTDSVFTRSLALSICRLLRIPSEPVLAGLPKHEAAKLASNPEGINAPFKEKTLRSLMSPAQEPGTGSAVKLAAVLLIAVAGGAGFYFWPQWQSAQGDAIDAVAQGAASEPLFMPQLQVEPEASNTEGAAATAQDAAAAVMAEPATAPAQPAPAEVVAVTPPATAALPAPTGAVAGERVLRFTATAQSWVQVRDAQQQVVMEKILKSGDVFEEVAVGRPLHVVIGNAEATRVEVDGSAFDFAGSAKNNVARFEVK
ncbi:helix-turn-helix domain-containing protein [Comamonas sp.]|uniref:helix-turn-helix domain-containing protein n=1 Tax=Comamonas sp. TaxID=34028 RepID=UPI00258AD15F|nr:helix-turn-helix domain-containing protein [Comamonas sp.]